MNRKTALASLLLIAGVADAIAYARLGRADALPHGWEPVRL